MCIRDSPATIGLLTGGLQAARTGSVQKGLLAGMGAYGGAGLAGGLMGAGAAEIGAQATQAAGYTPEIASGTPLSEVQGLQQAAVKNAGANVLSEGAKAAVNNPSQVAGLMGGWGNTAKLGAAAAAPMLAGMMAPQNTVPQAPKGDSTMPQRLQYNPGVATDPQTGKEYTPPPDVPGYGDLGRDFGKQQSYFPTAGFQNITPEQAKQMRGYAAGGFMGGGPVEAMSNANAIGANTGYPQADVNKAAYATPWQTPVSQNVVQGTADTGVNSMTGEQNEFAKGGLSAAASHLGDYSDGGRLLKGPGDGVSDSIPATIGNKRPARLADGEFVVPARIVSELGNGSTEAGARKLYAMLDRVQAARKKSIGKGKVAKNSRADKLLPA
jgi:hypothetical protein